MSTLAKKMLEKYGWKQGEGLGKAREGATTYVKVVRRDPHTATGLGHAADAARGGELQTAHAVELDAVYGELQQRRRRRSASSSSSQDDDSSSSSSTSSSSSSSSTDENATTTTRSADVTSMSDAELFRRCGGVRLGRAGRHRLFDGKLARIEGSARDTTTATGATAPSNNNSKGEHRRDEVDTSRSTHKRQKQQA